MHGLTDLILRAAAAAAGVRSLSAARVHPRGIAAAAAACCTCCWTELAWLSQGAARQGLGSLKNARPSVDFEEPAAAELIMSGAGGANFGNWVVFARLSVTWPIRFVIYRPVCVCVRVRLYGVGIDWNYSARGCGRVDLEFRSAETVLAQF